MTPNELIKILKEGWYTSDYDTVEASEVVLKLQAEIEQLRKVVEDTIGQAFYEDDYHKAQAEIEQLKALVISLSDRNANLQYTRSKK